MKFFITTLLVALQLASLAQSGKFTGTWSGTLSVGVDLRVVFNISQNENGSYVLVCGTTSPVLLMEDGVLFF